MDDTTILKQRSEEYQKSLSEQVSHSRWMTTLCMAEVAAIAAYTNIASKDNNLGIAWSTIIVLLGLSISSYILCILCARYARTHISDAIIGLLNAAKDQDPETGLFKVTPRKKKGIESEFREYQLTKKRAEDSENAGTVLFALSTLLCAILLLSSEIVYVILQKAGLA